MMSNVFKQIPNHTFQKTKEHPSPFKLNCQSCFQVLIKPGDIYKSYKSLIWSKTDSNIQYLATIIHSKVGQLFPLVSNRTIPGNVVSAVCVTGLQHLGEFIVHALHHRQDAASDTVRGTLEYKHIRHNVSPWWPYNL